MNNPDLNDSKPLDPNNPAHRTWLNNLQGNILAGHGRDHATHIFLRLPADDVNAAKAVIAKLAQHITSAHKQAVEQLQFKQFRIPGSVFMTLHLSANGYRKLGLRERVGNATAAPALNDMHFVDGMAKNATTQFFDPPSLAWDEGFRDGDIDMMLLLADDDANFLARTARHFIDELSATCDVATVEHGAALRTDTGEGIEHFGYVDGRSQPLFLATDFEGLEEGGAIGPNTREKDGSLINSWNPFEPLQLVLLADPMLPGRDDCFGSYLVFRKLEQNVRAFTVAEQTLADHLQLQGRDRARAGAMTVGRFRDGTPLVLSQTDGLMPPKENNFRFDGTSGDPQGLKCPFHAHIRKTNPRGDSHALGATEQTERSHRIARRGIPYGARNRHPNAFNALEDLPSEGVGLLFMCYQADIVKQFAFMQRTWANNPLFSRGTGIDPIIGMLDSNVTPADAQQQWPDQNAQPKPFFFGDFVKMKGGEFFFTPSIPFLRSLQPGTA